MNKFHKCEFHGSRGCITQGGDGSLFHPDGYEHPIAHVSNEGLSKAIETPPTDLAFSFYDNETARTVLGLSIEEIASPYTIVHKSLYNFDLESKDGVERVLSLIPILDEEILFDVYKEVFPGYDTDSLSLRMARVELRGYFMDYLEALGA